MTKRTQRRPLFPTLLRIAKFASPLIAIIFFIAAGGVFCAATLHVRKSVSATPQNAATIELVAHDGARLSAWWLHPAQPNGNCVIVLHGIADSRGSSVGFAPMFLEQGYSVLVPDSRAHGASGGAFVTYGLLEKYDVIAWAHWMRGAGCQKNYGLGESLGAAILIQAAALEPAFSAIVAECAYADLRQIAEYRVRQVLNAPSVIAVPVAALAVSAGMIYARFVDGVNLSQVSPVNSIAHTSTPILLIHGLRDTQTPPSHSRQLAAANRRDPLWLVPQADHTAASSAEPEAFRRRVLAWFREH